MARDHERPSVPVFEREVVDAEARRRHGDYDKVATTSTNPVSWNGIVVESRYADAAELKLMLDMIAVLPERYRSILSRVWCDSKLGNSYAVELTSWNDADAATIGRALADVAMKAPRGLFGLSVHEGSIFGNGRRLDVEAE